MPASPTSPWRPPRSCGSLGSAFDDSQLVVLWTDTANPGPGYKGVADGAVWVAVPPGYHWSEYDGNAEPNELTWADATVPGGYAMVVAVLPEGYTLDLDLVHTPPQQVKAVEDRVCLWWKLEGDRGTCSWFVRAFRTGETVGAAVKETRHKIQQKDLPDPPVSGRDVASWRRRRHQLQSPDEIRALNVAHGLTPATGDVRRYDP